MVVVVAKTVFAIAVDVIVAVEVDVFVVVATMSGVESERQPQAELINAQAKPPTGAPLQDIARSSSPSLGAEVWTGAVASLR